MQLFNIQSELEILHLPNMKDQPCRSISFFAYTKKRRLRMLRINFTTFSGRKGAASAKKEPMTMGRRMRDFIEQCT